MTRTSIALHKADIFPPDLYKDEISRHPSGVSVVLKRNTFLHVSENTFSFVTSEFIGGVNVHSGKHWFRWREDHSTTLSLKKKGADGIPRPNLYRFVRSPRFFGNISASPSSFVNYLNTYSDKVVPLLREFLNHHGLLQPDAFPLSDGTYRTYKYTVDTLNLIFPMLRLLHPITEETGITGIWFGILSPAMREHTLEAYTRKLFGAKRYRKDLVKALAKAPLSAHSRAVSAAGLVPMDWIIEGLRAFAGVTEPYGTPTLTVYGAPARRDFRTFLKDCPYHLRRRHVNSSQIVIAGLLHEAAHMWRRSTVFEIDYRKSILDNHDEWTTLYRVGRGQWNQFNEADPIPEIPQTKKIAETPVPGYEIIPARTRGDLQKWGEEMHNCISGYYSTASDPDAKATYLGIYREGALLANVEIRSGVIKQLLGKYNKAFSGDRFAEVAPVVEEWLRHGIVKNDFRNTWGIDINRITVGEITIDTITNEYIPEDQIWVL